MAGKNPIHHFLWREQIESISFSGALRCSMSTTSPISHFRHQHISSNLSWLDTLLLFCLPFRINLIMIETLLALVTPNATHTKGYVPQKSVVKGALIGLTNALSLNFNNILSHPSKQEKKLGINNDVESKDNDNSVCDDLSDSLQHTNNSSFRRFHEPCLQKMRIERPE